MRERKCENRTGVSSISLLLTCCLGVLFLNGCHMGATTEAEVKVTAASEVGDAVETEQAASGAAALAASAAWETDLAVQTASPSEAAADTDAAAQAAVPEGARQRPDEAPPSSYGLGSAAFLKGRNVLASLFLTTPEGGFTEEEQHRSLEKIAVTVNYLEEQAASYGVSCELIYDFVKYPELKKEAEVNFLIREDQNYVELLDEAIAGWKEQLISYEELCSSFQAEGAAVMIFVNGPGISYAVFFDGTDSEEETMVLFTEDYDRPGQAETAAAYAHEILHVFGAHDLYEDGEYGKEITDYVKAVYPDEIMLQVDGSGTAQKETIRQIISDITAYHLGWSEAPAEVAKFPALVR